VGRAPEEEELDALAGWGYDALAEGQRRLRPRCRRSSAADTRRSCRRRRRHRPGRVDAARGPDLRVLDVGTRTGSAGTLALSKRYAGSLRPHHWLRETQARRLLDRITRTVITAFGVRLALSDCTAGPPRPRAVLSAGPRSGWRRVEERPRRRWPACRCAG
jgi:hypothetical protein